MKVFEIPTYLQGIVTNLGLTWQQSFYSNLVIKGGGVRGIAYIGALEALDELGAMQHIERTAGSSAGALIATLASMRRGSDGIKTLFDTLDTTKSPKPLFSNLNFKFWKTDLRSQGAVRRFVDRFGLYSSEYFHEWVQEMIAIECQGNGRATFADFRANDFLDLHIMVTNLSRSRGEIFSYHTTPDVAVADAVRMSMSIPLFFEALQFDGYSFGSGDYYGDGGVYNNFPIRIFDNAAYVKSPRAFRDGVNWETLGLFLYPQRLMGEKVEPQYPQTVWQYLAMSLQNMQYSYEVSAYIHNAIDNNRTIEINDHGISVVDFDITIGGEKYLRLLESGRAAVYDFFDGD